MGKDKLYLSNSEHSKSQQLSRSAQSSKLPFWYCSVSQQPISEGCGVADKHGHVFDLKNLFPYVRKNKKNPVTYEPMTTKDVVKLKIAKNGEVQYADPVTLKQFSANSDAVVVRTSGNVYDRSTIQEHNVKLNSMTDLVSGEKFTMDDVIRLVGGAGVASGTTKKESENRTENKGVKRKAVEANDKDVKRKMSALTSHRLATSVTSTVVQVATENEQLEVPVLKLLKQKKFKDGYATLVTNYGSIRLELNAWYSPKAAYNFVILANKGYYDGTKVHRNIKHFMMQAGDPTGTGNGGRSAFEQETFADETNTPLRLDARGVLAMANRGKNTNTSQFFITYRPAVHLNGKHTVFGKVIGDDSLATLEKIELVEVDKNDRPKDDVVIETIRVEENPFENIHGDKDVKINEEDDTTALLTNEEVAPTAKVASFVDEGPLEFDDDSDDARRANEEDRISKHKKAVTLKEADFASWLDDI